MSEPPNYETEEHLLDGESIYMYFTRKFGCPPEDDTLKELPVFSNCGEDCRQAIDRAFEFSRSVNRANPQLLNEVLLILNDTISIFWRG